MTWYKDGVLRQRFDVQGDLSNVLHSTRFSTDRASIFTFGKGDRVVVCSDEFPATPSDAEATGPKGSCCEGSSTCGDLAGLLLFAAGLPLGYSESDVGQFTAASLTSDGTSVSWSNPRRIAGRSGRCYVATVPRAYPDDGSGRTDMCFSDGGLQLYLRTHGTYGDVEQQATDIASEDRSDFQLPCAVFTPTSEG